MIRTQEVVFKIIKLLRYFLTVLKAEGFYAIRFRGGLHGTGEPIQLLFHGAHDLLVEAFFDGSPEREVLGAFHPFSAGHVLKTFCDDNIDIVVAPDFLSSLRRKGSLIVPAFLEAKVPLPDTIDKYVASLQYDARRKIKRALQDRYQFETGTSKEDYVFYHEKMHVPFVTQRHGDRAYIIPFDQLYADARKALLVFVKQNGQRIAGFHVFWPRSSLYLYFHNMGMVPEVFMEAQRMRNINTAIYLRMHEIAIEHKCAGMDLGITPPVLGNGIIFFKSRWGASFYPASNPFRHRIQFLCSQERQKRILKHQRPLIHLDQGELGATVRIDEERMPSGELVNTLQRMWFRNLARIDVVHPSGRLVSLTQG